MCFFSSEFLVDSSKNDRSLELSLFLENIFTDFFCLVKSENKYVAPTNTEKLLKKTKYDADLIFIFLHLVHISESHLTTK